MLKSKVLQMIAQSQDNKSIDDDHPASVLLRQAVFDAASIEDIKNDIKYTICQLRMALGALSSLSPEVLVFDDADAAKHEQGMREIEKEIGDDDAIEWLLSHTKR